MSMDCDKPMPAFSGGLFGGAQIVSAPPPPLRVTAPKTPGPPEKEDAPCASVTSGSSEGSATPDGASDEENMSAPKLPNLEKAADEAEAEAFLRLLSGRAHQCLTGIAVKAPDGRLSARTVLARVKFKRLTDRDIADYVVSGDWKGKAGGYGIQGAAGAFVTAINGSYTAIVGLPLYETKALLEGMGWRAP